MFRVGNLHGWAYFICIYTCLSRATYPQVYACSPIQKTPLSRCLLYVTEYYTQKMSYTRVTFFALGPFWPSTTSKETVSPT